MFSSRRHEPSHSFSSRYGAGKATKAKRSFKEHSVVAGLQRSESVRDSPKKEQTSPPVGSLLTSPIITLVVGSEQRLFAGHEDVICRSPFFRAACKEQFQSNGKRIVLPDEHPEILSSVLEYLYKGDYYPRLLQNKKKGTWELEIDSAQAEPTVYHHALKQTLLKDTLIYCAALRYGLEELRRFALRKQGLRAGIQISTILASARYTYAHTPDSDAELRAHYLTLIIRSRDTFKRSGTMEKEMGKLFFDLFVAMCNQLEDQQTMRSPFSR